MGMGGVSGKPGLKKKLPGKKGDVATVHDCPPQANDPPITDPYHSGLAQSAPGVVGEQHIAPYSDGAFAPMKRHEDDILTPLNPPSPIPPHQQSPWKKTSDDYDPGDNSIKSDVGTFAANEHFGLAEYVLELAENGTLAKHGIPVPNEAVVRRMSTKTLKAVLTQCGIRTAGDVPRRLKY